MLPRIFIRLEDKLRYRRHVVYVHHERPAHHPLDAPARLALQVVFWMISGVGGLKIEIVDALRFSALKILFHAGTVTHHDAAGSGEGQVI